MSKILGNNANMRPQSRLYTTEGDGISTDANDAVQWDVSSSRSVSYIDAVRSQPFVSVTIAASGSSATWHIDQASQPDGPWDTVLEATQSGESDVADGNTRTVFDDEIDRAYMRVRIDSEQSHDCYVVTRSTATGEVDVDMTSQSVSDQTTRIEADNQAGGGYQEILRIGRALGVSVTGADNLPVEEETLDTAINATDVALLGYVSRALNSVGQDELQTRLLGLDQNSSLLEVGAEALGVTLAGTENAVITKVADALGNVANDLLRTEEQLAPEYEDNNSGVARNSANALEAATTGQSTTNSYADLATLTLRQTDGAFQQQATKIEATGFNVDDSSGNSLDFRLQKRYADGTNTGPWVTVTENTAIGDNTATTITDDPALGHEYRLQVKNNTTDAGTSADGFIVAGGA